MFMVLGAVTVAILITRRSPSESAPAKVAMSTPPPVSAPVPAPTHPDIAGPAENLIQIKTESLQLAQHLVASFPREQNALNMLGDVLYEHGDVSQAMDTWERALALNPQRVEIYRKLGVAAKGQGDPNTAISYWQQALKADPNSPNLRWHLAEVAIDQGRHEDAVTLLERECQITPKAVRNVFLLGQTYLQLQDYPRAVTQYQKAISLEPDHYNAYYGLGTAYLRLEDRAQAQRAMEQFQQLKRQNDARPDKQVKIDEVPAARRRMAQHYAQAYHLVREANQPQAGVWLLQRAVALDPGNTLLLELLGVHYYTTGQLPQALRIYEQARRIDPNNPHYPLNCGKIFRAQKRPSQAQAMFSQVITRFPSYSQGYTELAELYLRTQHNAPKAMALARQALHLEASARNYFLVAWGHDIDGDYPAALAAIDQAVALAPQNRNYRTLRDNLMQKVAAASPGTEGP